MAHVNVTIAGRAYRMACGEGEEPHLESLARLIDARIAEMRANFGEIGDQRLTVMAAITVADELAEAKRRIGALEEEIAAARADARRAQARGDDMADAAAEAIEAAAGRLEGMAHAMNAQGRKPLRRDRAPERPVERSSEPGQDPT